MNTIALPESAHPAAPPGVAGSLHLLACPNCRDKSAPLYRENRHFRCRRCKTRYPVIRCNGDEVPWLYPQPASAFGQWHDRHVRLSAELEADIERINNKLDGYLYPTTRKRLERLLRAKRDFARQIEHLLSPFELSAYQADNNQRALLPQSQTITSYQTNIFRDWVWGKDEIEAAYAAVQTVLQQARVSRLGKLITLGAGPGALPYLLEQRLPTELSVKFDINPLFAAVNTAMMAGGSVELIEFPTAPVNLNHCALTRTCRLDNTAAYEHPIPSNYVLGDVSHMPFVDAGFDTVFTPWLVDLLPGQTDALIGAVNRLLPAGGTWLCTGSMNFLSAEPSANLCAEELMERIRYSGFVVKAHDSARLPYLQSPASAHHRNERVFSFCATKTHEVDLMGEQNPPADAVTPLPVNPDTRYTASNYLLRAQVLSAIDGKRNINDITQAIARKYDLEFDAALRVVTGIIKEEYKR